MKAPNGPAILALFCVLVFALCWVAITFLTTPTRAVASGVVLSALTGLFIWFAKSDRYALARGVIAVGVTAVAAPLAAVQAATNDVLFSMLADEDEIGNRILELDAILDIGWRNAAIGAAVGIVLIVVGGVLHRQRRDA